MAIKTRDEIKQTLQTGDYPTEVQFSDLVDSFWHKTDELIPINKIQGLSTAFADFLASINTLVFAAFAGIEGTFDTSAVKEIEIPEGAIYAGILIQNTSDADDVHFFIEILKGDMTTLEYMPETVYAPEEQGAEEQRIYGPCTMFITTMAGAASFKIFK